MSEANVEVVRQILDAYSRRNIDALRAMSHPDLELDWSASRGPLAGVYRGVEEALRFYQEYYETFETTSVVPDELVDAGDSVVVPNVVYQRGRDGIDLSVRSTLVFTIRNRKLTRIRLFQAEREALRAVGRKE